MNSLKFFKGFKQRCKKILNENNLQNYIKKKFLERIKALFTVVAVVSLLLFSTANDFSQTTITLSLRMK